MTRAGKQPSVRGQESSPKDDEALAGELVAVAFIVKTRGIRGEVAAELLTGFPERFEQLETLIAVSPEGKRFLVRLEDYWFQGERIILKLAGYDTPETAAALVRHELTVPEAETVELGEDEFYEWQLVGCRVETIEGRALGEVREVLQAGSAPILIIRDEHEREQLVPLVQSICVEIDVERKLVRVDAPEGLLEL